MWVEHAHVIAVDSTPSPSPQCAYQAKLISCLIVLQIMLEPSQPSCINYPSSCSLGQSTGSGSLRLVARNGQTSTSLTAGRLEIYYNGQWGTVCNDNFGISEARTACAQLGYSNYLNYETVGSSLLG